MLEKWSVVEKKLPVFSGKVPGVSRGDLGNPAETGWRGTGLLCEKGQLLFAVRAPIGFPGNEGHSLQRPGVGVHSDR